MPVSRKSSDTLENILFRMHLGQASLQQHGLDGGQEAEENEEDGMGKLLQLWRAAAAIPLLGLVTQVQCITEQAVRRE